MGTTMQGPDLLDGSDGPLVGLAELAKLLPGRGTAHPSPSCLTRWVCRGAKAADGTRHRLQAVKAGSRWLSTANALRRFTQALSADPGAATAVEPRSPAERTRASERAAAELAAMGV